MNCVTTLRSVGNFCPILGLVTRVLIGVRGLPDATAAKRVVVALQAVPGVGEVMHAQPGQMEVHYDPSKLTVMDLIRAVRGQGFPAGML